MKGMQEFRLRPLPTFVLILPTFAFTLPMFAFNSFLDFPGRASTSLDGFLGFFGNLYGRVSSLCSVSEKGRLDRLPVVHAGLLARILWFTFYPQSQSFLSAKLAVK